MNLYYYQLLTNKLHSMRQHYIMLKYYQMKKSMFFHHNLKLYLENYQLLPYNYLLTHLIHLIHYLDQLVQYCLFHLLVLYLLILLDQYFLENRYLLEDQLLQYQLVRLDLLDHLEDRFVQLVQYYLIVSLLFL